MGMLRLQVEKHQGGVALDSGQEIVEVVGDPAGEGSDRLHLL